ncbi:hypothetical protein [Nonomuraea typhae]|uniref:DUF2613 family protein n=1 Tax=Nonomuraea typhae TaxID=2603600 RepID=A0ABW7YXI2_9ACTN|nr:hypothetical protein [Nonomuraea typhae]
MGVVSAAVALGTFLAVNNTTEAGTPPPVELFQVQQAPGNTP